MKVTTEAFGTAPGGQPITKFVLENSKGSRVTAMNWGAALLDIEVPDKEGKLANVNLRFATAEQYFSPHDLLGSTAGRVAGRIKDATFTIDGVESKLSVNHCGKNTTHGGEKGFAYQWFAGETYEAGGAAGIRFTYKSPDGDQGFPGTADVVVDYNWNDACELRIDFRATTDKPTHVNLTNHAYFNLKGFGVGTVREHEVELQCDQYLDAAAPELIPNGKLLPVEGTPHDFRKQQAFGAKIDELTDTGGYDSCYAIRGADGTMRRVAFVLEPASRRTMTIETTQPGLYLYTGNCLGGNERSAGAASQEAFCLETMHFPDAPHHPHFPSTLLRPGEHFEQKSIFRFGVQA